MLVLTRKCSELIQIGDDIVIKVIKTGRNTVKIGIEAPKSVRVSRGEVVLRTDSVEETPPSPECEALTVDEPDHQPARLENLRRVGSALLPDDPKSCLVC